MSYINIELTDSSDWKATRAPFLTGIESTLRCHICKEFMTAPVLTACFHTFCSLCIRSHLNEEDSCPVCRTKTQSSNLRKNTVVEELITLFKEHRRELLELVQEHNNGTVAGEELNKPVGSQKDNIVNEDGSDESSQDLRRSKRRRTDINYQVESQEEDNNNNDDPNFGECPVCGKRMPIADIESSHIAECLSGKNANTPLKKSEPSKRGFSGFVTTEHEDMTKKIGAIAYNLYTYSKLQELLRKLGIPATGSKDQMEQRHKQWVTLWNANADSEHPEPKSYLLLKLSKWEKQLHTNKNASKLDIKKMNNGEWVTQHQGEFTDLLAQAKASAKKAASKKAKLENTMAPEEQQTHETTNHDL